MDISSLINLARYPLHRPDSHAYAEVISDARAGLSQDHILALPGFLSEEGLPRLVEEAERATPKAFHCVKSNSPYNKPLDDSLPPNHPARIFHPTERHGVAYHDLRDGLMGELYRWVPLRRFVAAVLSLPQLFLHEDPSNALVLQVYKQGGQLAWHFDRARFSTILQLQTSDRGGYFEAAPAIRSEEDENYDAVYDLMTDKTAAPLRRRSEPGTFVILYGRHCLHRVTKVEGEKARMSLILSYEEQPGIRLDNNTRRLFFGPSAPLDP